MTGWAAYFLALTIWREARGDGAIGMRAVAHVVLNRMMAGKKTCIEVLIQPNAFSSISFHNDPQTTTWPKDNDLDFENACVIAAGIGGDPDLTHGALYYENTATATSTWFNRDVRDHPELHPVTAVIGHQSFFA